MELIHLEDWTGQEPPARLKSHFILVKGRWEGKPCSSQDGGGPDNTEVRSCVLGSLEITAIHLQPSGH